MARRKPIIIDNVVTEVADSAKLSDIVPRNVTSIVTTDGRLVRREDFERVKLPDGFETNLSPINKGAPAGGPTLQAADGALPSVAHPLQSVLPLVGTTWAGDPARTMADCLAALQHCAAQDLPDALRAGADNHGWLEAVARDSYRHANGFTKLVLGGSAGGRLRLHVWEPGAAAEENIHDHRWHFASVILSGTIKSEVWVDAIDPAAPTFEEFIYEVRDGVASRRSVGRTRASCARTATRRAGAAYVMVPGVMHRITGTEGVTATLVVTTTPSRRWNRMLSSHGIRPNVDRQPLDTTEVRRLIDLVLRQLTLEDSHVRRH